MIKPQCAAREYMDIVLHLGSCPNVNGLVEDAINRISGANVKVVPFEPDLSGCREGTVPMQSTCLKVDGVEVASGFVKIDKWLTEHHNKRVIEKQVFRYRNPERILVGASA